MFYYHPADKFNFKIADTYMFEIYVGTDRDMYEKHIFMSRRRK